MKRIIALLILTVLCFGVLTSCEAVDTVKGWFGIGGEEESTGLAEADVYLHKLYSGKDGSKVSNSFDVVGKVPGAGKFLEVTWTADNEKVEIVPSTTAGYYTVKLPANNTEEFTFSITATITDANGDTKTRTYSFTMIVVNNDVIVTEPQEGVDYKFFLYQGKYQQNLYMLNTTQDGGNKFINTSNDPKVAAVFNVEKVEGGYKFYTMINNVKNYIYAYTTQNGEKISKFIGYSTTNSTVFYYDTEVGGAWMTNINDYPYGVGTYDIYKTVSLSDGSFFTPAEVGNSQYVMKIVTAEYANSQTPDEEPTVEVPEANTTLTIPEAIELGGKVVDYTEGKYYISGSIVNITSDTYGNMNIQDAEGNKILVYGTYDKTGANRFDAMNPQPAVGDTIVVYGVIGNHKGTPQMKDGWIQSINGVELEGSTPGGETPETPSTTIGVVAAPVAGTAYKFGMVQTNAGKTVYLVGGMDGYYMATTEDVAAAIDVYLEETEGGYYLYTLDGETKTYINMVVSEDGEHVNGAYQATASTVYTYNAESKTIIAVVNEVEYWFGTRSDKSYTTVGPCAVSYAGFYCQFYGEVEGGNEGSEGETPVDPETPSTTLGVVDAPVAGTAYKFGMVQTNAGKTVYLVGGMDGYYMATTEDVAAAIDVYLEETEGGYYLYTLDGETKTYINMVVSEDGEHVNGAYQATASTVYTYNAESKTIIAVVNEVEYWFGTRSDKSYTTVGPCAVSYAGFYCQFYGEVEGGEDVGGGNEGGEGETPVDPETPSTPTVITTIPDALAAAEGAKVKLTGTVHSFYENWSSYNNCSPYIVDEAGNKILVFRTTTRVYVGDVITVEGTVTIYNAVAQIAQSGSVVTVTTPHTCTFSDATCTEASACTACGAAGTDAALGHTAANADGKCDRCGIDLSVSYVEKELSFADKANRTTFTTSQQVWVQNGITLTNDKGSSTSNVADYADPARFYKSSKLTVEFSNMTKIEFVCNSDSYATALQGSIAANANYTVTVSGSTVTVIFAEAVNSFVVNSLTGGQVRMNSLTVTAIDK